jgi:B12 binding domain
MQIKLVSLEDGITSCGFRKMAAFAARINDDTESCYVSTNRYRSIRNGLRGTLGSAGSLEPEDIDLAARDLIRADLVGFSSMTGYSDLTRKLIKRVKELDRSTYVIWGGIHPIIHPEDAILSDVDAICTGEGEFAFQELYESLVAGHRPTNIKNFWFRDGEEVIRNHFLPLMSQDEMESLPFPQYGEGELIYQAGDGFIPMKVSDYIDNDGLSYTTLWSIGCPFHCSYCGNTKFISNDPKYKRIRHPSARYIIDEVKTARARFPHLSQVSFHDDSFMAIPYRQIEEFAELWKAASAWASRAAAATRSSSTSAPRRRRRSSPPARSTRRSRRRTTSPRPTTSSPTTRSRPDRTCVRRCSCSTTWSDPTRSSSTR